MPKITITHNAGAAPVLAGNAQRTFLFLQNNTLFDVFYRMTGEVSLVDDAKAGLLLAKAPSAGQPGGSVILTGAIAQKPIYALHSGGGSDTVKLDAEGDAGL